MDGIENIWKLTRIDSGSVLHALTLVFLGAGHLACYEVDDLLIEEPCQEACGLTSRSPACRCGRSHSSGNHLCPRITTQPDSV